MLLRSRGERGERLPGKALAQSIRIRPTPALFRRVLRRDMAILSKGLVNQAGLASSTCLGIRHRLAMDPRRSLLISNGSASCLRTGPMRHTPAFRNIEICSGGSCGSSVVEHSLGKGEAESSILSRSTSICASHHRKAAVAFPRRTF